MTKLRSTGIAPLTCGVAAALVLLCCVVAPMICEAKLPGSASVWNENIDWVHWDHALAQGKSTGKPIMMVIHKSWCAACKALKARFVNSPEIEALSEHFVMANVEDDDEPADEKYSPQGAYSPRILFLTFQGEVADIKNDVVPDPQHLHFYGTAEEIVASMLEALRVLVGIEDINEL
jgi:protein-disulfide reductase (glutathione)